MRIKKLLFGFGITAALSACALSSCTEDKKANVGKLETNVEAAMPLSVFPVQYGERMIVRSYDTLFRNNESLDQIADGLNIQSWKERYSKFVHEAAQKYGLKPKLLFDLIEMESNGNPGAISCVGAIGLMQVMPSTAEEYDIKGNLFEPRINIMTGAAILSDYLNKFNHNLKCALAAYNAGPTKVKQAISGGVLHVHKLPGQTQRYINTYFSYNN